MSTRPSWAVRHLPVIPNYRPDRAGAMERGPAECNMLPDKSRWPHTERWQGRRAGKKSSMPASSSGGNGRRRRTGSCPTPPLRHSSRANRRRARLGHGHHAAPRPGLLAVWLNGPRGQRREPSEHQQGGIPHAARTAPHPGPFPTIPARRISLRPRQARGPRRRPHLWWWSQERCYVDT